MPVDHRRDGSVRVITVRGRLTPDELLGGLGEALTSDSLPAADGLLIDVSESDTLPPPEILQQIAKLLGAHREHVGPQVAVLVAHTVRYGLARQLGAWLENMDIEAHPFHARAEALAWLAGTIDATD